MGIKSRNGKKKEKKLYTRREEKRGAIYRIVECRKERLAAKIEKSGQEK